MAVKRGATPGAVSPRSLLAISLLAVWLLPTSGCGDRERSGANEPSEEDAQVAMFTKLFEDIDANSSSDRTSYPRCLAVGTFDPGTPEDPSPEVMDRLPETRMRVLPFSECHHRGRETPEGELANLLWVGPTDDDKPGHLWGTVIYGAGGGSLECRVDREGGEVVLRDCESAVDY